MKVQRLTALMDFPPDYGVKLDAVNDPLPDFADTVDDDGQPPSPCRREP